MKKCPYCAEKIQDEAIICRYCGSNLKTNLPPDQEKTISTPEIKARSSIADGVKLGTGMFIVLPFLIFVGLCVAIWAACNFSG